MSFFKPLPTLVAIGTLIVVVYFFSGQLGLRYDTQTEDLPKPKSILKIGVVSDFAPVNPIETTGTFSANVLDMVYDPLVFSDKDGNAISNIAYLQEISDDGKTFRFEIKDGIRFHNGHPLNAKNTIKVLQQSISRLPKNHLLQSNIKSIDSYGNNFIEITLKEFDALFIHEISRLYIYDLESKDSPPAGSGPFEVTSFSPNKIELSKTGAWHRGMINIDGIQIFSYTSEKQIWNDLLAKKIDVRFGNHDKFSESLVKVPYLKELPYRDWHLYSLILNNKNALFESQEVRTALNLLVKRSLLTKQVSHAIPAYSLVFDPNPNTVFDLDPNRAAALFEKAGWKKNPKTNLYSKNNKPFRFTIYYLNGDKVSQRIATY